MKSAKFIIAAIVLIAVELASAQLKIGDNTQLTAGGLATFGYAGDYGNDIPSSHGLNFGLSGKVDGSYYNPNFINFSATPYINQSRNDSNYQSLTGASGILGTANFFTGSNFPGTVSYRYDANSTGTFGLVGQPNFTTRGRGDGFSVGWSALLPNLPTLSFGYSQGSGSGNVYGTDQQTTSDNRLFNVRSTYQIEGFHLNGFYNHLSYENKYPEFLTGEPEAAQNSSGSDYGFGANHNLPFHGSFYANFNHSVASTDFLAGTAANTSYTDNTENAGVNFNPTRKLSLFANQSYTDNLAGYLSQSAGSNVVVPINLGSGSHSMLEGAGASYNFTNFLYGEAQATHYDQYFFGQDYRGTYLSGTVGLSKKLFNLFTFSATVIESNNFKGSNEVGFMGNVNYYHRFGNWLTSGQFSYAQNVQSILITYTTSYYNYGGSVRRRFSHHMQWTGAFGGSHSGLTNQPGSNSHSESYSTAFGARVFTVNGTYTQSSGLSILGLNGLQPVGPTPGLENTILFAGNSYSGGLSTSPLRRLVLTAAFSRALSNTTGTVLGSSRNNTEIFNTQLQYHLRRIGLMAGYTKFIQGISAGGALPANTNSYFVGVSRWFDFF